jgi:peptidoglycan biosynthesis protein MviN/MurJ (putative lipid II flippase)
MGRLFTREARGRIGRMLIAASLAGVAGAWPYAWLLARWEGWELGSRLLGTALLYGGIAGVYLVTAELLGLAETRRLVRRLVRRG